MKYLKEITGVADGFRYPEHIYILNEAGKLVGYIKENTDDIKIFNKPLSFSKSRRKFTEVKGFK